MSKPEVDASLTLLARIADQLERWAMESRKGGWSTHQVDPMTRLAAQINEHLGRYIGRPNPLAVERDALLAALVEAEDELDSYEGTAGYGNGGQSNDKVVEVGVQDFDAILGGIRAAIAKAKAGK